MSNSVTSLEAITAEYGISQDYAVLVTTANLDWQVAQHVRWIRLAHEHSANEVKAAYIAAIAIVQHGREAFETAVENY